MDDRWCPLRGLVVSEEECAGSCPAPEQRVVCAMEGAMNNLCQDCGAPATGTRCRRCNGAFIRLEAARALQRSDQELIQWVAEGLSADRIAARLGVSKPRAYARVRDAKRRQLMLSIAQGIPPK